MAALWRSVASIWVCASCERAGLAWASENGDRDSGSPVYMSLAVLRHSVGSISSFQASDSQVGEGCVCWVRSWRDHSLTWGGPKHRERRSLNKNSINNRQKALEKPAQKTYILARRAPDQDHGTQDREPDNTRHPWEHGRGFGDAKNTRGSGNGRES